MATHRKQHYVPSCYTKAWCDPATPKGQTPYVWISDKYGGNIRNKAPEKILHETDLYTIQFGDGKRDLCLEHGLSQLENEFVFTRDKKLIHQKELDERDRFVLAAFTAAAQARTPANRDHQRKQWERSLKMMEEMREWAKKATPEQLKQASGFPPSSGKGFTYDEVKALQEKPLQHLLSVSIQTTAPLLTILDLALLVTDDPIGFITTDNPCVWFDPDAHKRPSIYRAPGLAYDTIEITLPISPNMLLCWNRKGIKGYVKSPPFLVDELNRRNRFHAKDHLITQSGKTKPYWFQEKPTHWDANKEDDS